MTKTILIVDDEPNIVLSVEYLMKREGYQVMTANDGQVAIEMIADTRPDLLILDVMMPRKNGFEVCREIRADPALSGLPILMLSAKGREAEIKKGISLGADAYITKPFSTHDLVDKVNQLLQSRE
ncbi:MAG: response regulator [Candidatus Thiodiazotropha sp. (ex Lucina aurantia)]|uniref:Transcriptional regulatory protein YycF n=2 Tax=Candidatus Thiodiazotropha TaxID=1913444 RepID=A0A7Z0VJX1_9GAMM|nr:response regulator [Candidatus Thiodiazotropha endolucinida]MBT3012864.1 response regulator [Candidatus Thiodiazotropha sp. (ex Lucina pensylvanica)]MBT3024590.1 response regulator [Candidatus Thiodiazotropha taylori]MBT3040430.1 response regulator [Candidatus Thiodiazotropha sp. (ex Codakia orbicularis)]MBV2104335.1 response regulator [Candidatus Thiodiazotropha sp. (ex Lucina aurantia)]MBT3032176.1 response regulator [Candidatus Thiodiazotropha sp. (ex Lucina pensylvanica)]